MQNLLNPKWIFLINTLPIIILFLFFAGEYSIIKSLLSDESKNLWMYFGITLGILGVLNFLYAVIKSGKKQEVSVIYALLSLISFIPFIYLFGYNASDIIPFSIPRWMIPGGMSQYVGTFMMPTIAYSIFIIIVYFTPKDKEHKAGLNFLVAVFIPISWYVLFQVALPLWKPLENNFGIHAFLIFFISSTLVFFFFIVRGIWILTLKKSEVWKKYELVWKIPFTIIFPVIGLLINNGKLSDIFGSANYGIFGDFNSIWFFIIAILNGTLLCLPELKNKNFRLVLFVGKSITFAFTLYFFLVFLPFLPLSVIVIIVIGIGFLMLTPLVLFVIHINEYSKDLLFLQNYFSKKLLLVISLISFFVIPTFLTFSYYKDKSVLTESLDYIYNPDYSKNYNNNIDKTSLQKTLNILQDHRSRINESMFGNETPYLSTYFNWLVMDNMTLTDSKVNNIERVFFGKESYKLKTSSSQTDSAKLKSITSNSVYDETQKAWVSWVDLEIESDSGKIRNSEYSTVIDLPNGCWISDYYLNINGKKEMGILAEKKSAMWIYSQIQNENKDPGILYYLGGNEVAFKVFPVTNREVRKTGIEFLHKDPVKITIDGNVLQLGIEKENIISENFENENLVFVSDKKSLKSVQRKPYFHFLADVSIGKKIFSEVFTERIEKFLNDNKEFSENAQISFVNTYVNKSKITNKLKDQFDKQSFEGGFFLDRAVKSTLYDSYLNGGDTYPVLVVVTDSIQNAILNKDFSDLKFTFPESNEFYNLNENGKLEAHSLLTDPVKSFVDSSQNLFNHTVREFILPDNKKIYLQYNDMPDIVLKKDIFKIDDVDIKVKNWESALTLQGYWMSQTLHPETSDKDWLNLVRYSFVSKIMTPVTAYMTVENEAQKEMLKRKQNQVLSGNKSLDLGEDTERMSEPGFVLMAILLMLILFLIKKKKKILIRKSI
jgi:hypothetical protein